jgi:hypothetical protein
MEERASSMFFSRAWATGAKAEVAVLAGAALDMGGGDEDGGFLRVSKYTIGKT